VEESEFDENDAEKIVAQMDYGVASWRLMAERWWATYKCCILNYLNKQIRQSGQAITVCRLSRGSYSQEAQSYRVLTHQSQVCSIGRHELLSDLFWYYLNLSVKLECPGLFISCDWNGYDSDYSDVYHVTFFYNHDKNPPLSANPEQDIVRLLMSWNSLDLRGRRHCIFSNYTK
jgi:hypothetical protein